MTRIVGDRLRVNVGRKPEEEQIVDLRQLIESNDLVMGILGYMRLIKEPMECSPAMAIWEMQVDTVKQDTSPAQRVIQGPAAAYRSEKSEAFGTAVWAELRAVAQGL